jgi:superfamily I DNA and/or RNA helicase
VHKIEEEQRPPLVQKDPPHLEFEDKDLHELYGHNKKIDQIIDYTLPKLKKELEKQKSDLQRMQDTDKAKLFGRERYELENSFILDTPVICTTLSIAGSEQCSKLKNRIDYLIVDEAC